MEAPATDPRGNNLGRVEDGLQDILRHLERQHGNWSRSPIPAAIRPTAPPSIDPGLVDIVKRELSDMRFSQTETDRHTQDSLETVHTTLGHVVDRLARIEGDLRAVRPAPPRRPPPAPPPPRDPQCRRAAPRRRPDSSTPLRGAAQGDAPPPKPQLPNPAALRDCQPRRPTSMPRRATSTRPSRPRRSPRPMPPRAISEILGTARRRAARPMGPGVATGSSARARHPSRPGVSSPSERIAASEDAISEIAVRPKGRSARRVSLLPRAAPHRLPPQPATTRPRAARRPPTKPRTRPRPRWGQAARRGAKKSSTIGSKIRSLLVGASVVVIVLGTFKMAMTLLDTGCRRRCRRWKSPATARREGPAPAEQRHACVPAAPRRR